MGSAARPGDYELAAGGADDSEPGELQASFTYNHVTFHVNIHVKRYLSVLMTANQVSSSQS
jgi:hypothetical protein